MRRREHQSGFGVIEVLLIVIVVAVLAVTGLVEYNLNKPSSAKNSATTSPSQTTTQPKRKTTIQPVQSVYTGWKTYTSTTEKAHFQYPANWTATEPFIVSNDVHNTDQVGLTSPSGTIKISWVTDLSGFGGEHGTNYPYNTVIDKTAIANAPGLYVISGTTTDDGTTYYPWVAIQDSQGILTSKVQGGVATFTSHHALNPTTNSVTGILFATCGGRFESNSPALTQAKAMAWFSGQEAQQAKLILLSYSY